MLYFLRRVTQLLLAIALLAFAYEMWMPFPKELDITPRERRVAPTDVRFYADTTRYTEKGERVLSQTIWDHLMTRIDGARSVILFDMFLFNDFMGKGGTATRELSSELTTALVEKRASAKSIPMVFITDPINSVYGGADDDHLLAMERSGITTVVTDLTKLRDSNPVWSAFWRPYFSLFGNSTSTGRLSHPFDVNRENVSLRSWAALLNFKANHRKLAIYDVAGRPALFVTSSNPHDASSAHGNVGLEVMGNLAQDAWERESALARLSGKEVPAYPLPIEKEDGALSAMVLTESDIKERVLAMLDSGRKGDSYKMVMFYLSDRDIVSAMLRAAQRGATMRLILDPNKDAFGYEKNGIPNRPVAKELTENSQRSIETRWCDTHGEQCHAKLFMGTIGTTSFMMLGSANFTRRNLDDYNLETSVYVEGQTKFPAWVAADTYVTRLWTNDGGTYTLPYESYKDDTLWKSSLYRLMERTGLSSF